MDSVTCKKMDTVKPKIRNEIKWLLFTEIEAFRVAFKAFSGLFWAFATVGHTVAIEFKGKALPVRSLPLLRG